MNSPVSPTHNEGLAAEKKQDGAAPARILLVDDDPVNQMVALGLLRRHGWQAVAAANGREALQFLATQSFDVTVIRQNEAQSSTPSAAPGSSDGPGTRTDARGRHIPIIALTTASQPGVREKCLAAGMDDFLNKPVKPVELYAMVQKYLRENQ